jgi:hypothetical protein
MKTIVDLAAIRQLPRIAVLVVAGVLGISGLGSLEPPVAQAFDPCATANCAYSQVTFSGTGSGYVTDNWDQINCVYKNGITTGTCSTVYVYARFVSTIDVSLTVHPDALSYTCPDTCRDLGVGYGSGQTLSNGQRLALDFDLNAAHTYTAQLQIAGTGSGRVTSSPSGVDCSYATGSMSGTCSHQWYFAESAKFSFAVQPGSTSYGCWVDPRSCLKVGASFVGSYPVTASGGNVIKLEFNRGSRLSVAVQGAGNVMSTVGGIDCPSRCSAYYTPGSAVTLTATPATGYKLTGWTGACEAVTSKTCGLAIGTSDLVTTAKFAKIATAPPPTPRPTTAPASTTVPQQTTAGSPNPEASGPLESAGPSVGPGSSDVAVAGSAEPTQSAGGSTNSGPGGSPGSDTGTSGGALDLSIVGAIGIALLVVLVLGIVGGYLAARRRRTPIA